MLNVISFYKCAFLNSIYIISLKLLNIAFYCFSCRMPLEAFSKLLFVQLFIIRELTALMRSLLSHQLLMPQECFNCNYGM